MLVFVMYLFIIMFLLFSVCLDYYLFNSSKYVVLLTMHLILTLFLTCLFFKMGFDFSLFLSILLLIECIMIFSFIFLFMSYYNFSTKPFFNYFLSIILISNIVIIIWYFLFGYKCLSSFQYYWEVMFMSFYFYIFMILLILLVLLMLTFFKFSVKEENVSCPSLCLLKGSLNLLLDNNSFGSNITYKIFKNFVWVGSYMLNLVDFDSMVLILLDTIKGSCRKEDSSFYYFIESFCKMVMFSGFGYSLGCETVLLLKCYLVCFDMSDLLKESSLFIELESKYLVSYYVHSHDFLSSSGVYLLSDACMHPELEFFFKDYLYICKESGGKYVYDSLDFSEFSIGVILDSNFELGDNFLNFSNINNVKYNSLIMLHPEVKANYSRYYVCESFGIGLTPSQIIYSSTDFYKSVFMSLFTMFEDTHLELSPSCKFEDEETKISIMGNLVLGDGDVILPFTDISDTSGNDHLIPYNKSFTTVLLLDGNNSWMGWSSGFKCKGGTNLFQDVNIYFSFVFGTQYCVLKCLVLDSMGLCIMGGEESYITSESNKFPSCSCSFTTSYESLCLCGNRSYSYSNGKLEDSKYPFLCFELPCSKEDMGSVKESYEAFNWYTENVIGEQKTLSKAWDVKFSGKKLVEEGSNLGNFDEFSPVCDELIKKSLNSSEIEAKEFMDFGSLCDEDDDENLGKDDLMGVGEYGLVDGESKKTYKTSKKFEKLMNESWSYSKEFTDMDEMSNFIKEGFLEMKSLEEEKKSNSSLESKESKKKK